jgi:hypothetical protein
MIDAEKLIEEIQAYADQLARDTGNQRRPVLHGAPTPQSLDAALARMPVPPPPSYHQFLKPLELPVLSP